MANPTLRVQITADLADIKQGLGILRGELAKVRQEASGNRSGLGLLNEAAGELKSLLGGIGLAAAAYKAVDLGRKAINDADAIGKLAQKTGATTEFLSALRVAVHGSEEDFDLLGKSLARLAANQDAAASGNKDAVETFSRLGISLDQVKNSDPGELLVSIANKLAAMRDGAEKSALAQKVFGKAGADLIPILNNLASGGFEQATAKAKQLGISMSSEAADGAAALKDQLGDLGLQAEGLAAEFTSKLAPAAVTALQDIQDATSGDGLDIVSIIGQAVAGVIQTITSLFVGVGKVIGGTIALAVNAYGAIKDIATDALSGDFAEAKRRYAAALQQQKDLALAVYDDLKGEAGKVFDAFAGNSRLPKTAPRAAGGGTQGSGTDEVIKGVLDQAELAGDAIKRELATLQGLFDKGLVSIADFYARKKALQEAAIDTEIKQAEAEAATAKTSEAQGKALTRIVELQRDRAAIGPAIAEAQAKAEKDLADQLDQVKARLAELGGQSDVATRTRLEAQYRGLVTRLKAEGDVAGLELVNKLINTEAFSAKLGELQNRFQSITSVLSTGQTSISAQADAGLLPQTTAEQQLQDLRATSLQQLQALREQTIAYLATMSPDDPNAAKATQFLQQLDGNIAQVVASQHQLRGKIQDQAVNSLTNFFSDLATGAKTAKEAFRDLVLSFVQGLARMAAELLAKRIILSFLQSFGGGGGGGFGLGGTTGISVGDFGGFSAAVAHSGRLVNGVNGRTRSVSPALFGLAPRYHVGGLAGDEVPAILQRGERVLSRRETAAYDAGDRPAPGVRIVNAFDPSFVPDQMDSAAGEKVIFNILGRNPGRARSILGV